MDHAAFAELMAGRALGDLDVTEQRTVDTHLRQCSACRALTRDLDAVLGDLAHAAVPRPVPAALGPAILSAIHREASLPVRGIQPQRTPPSIGGLLQQARWGFLRRGAAVVLATAAVMAISVMGYQVVDLRQQLDDTRAAARTLEADISTRETAMQVVADPAHASAWLAPSTTDVTASARIVYRPGSTDTFLVASGLPASPDGHVYQFWYADASGVHAGITFVHDGVGVLLIPVEVDLRGAQAAMLTIELAGGADGGPSKDIVFGELPAS